MSRQHERMQAWSRSKPLVALTPTLVDSGLCIVSACAPVFPFGAGHATQLTVSRLCVNMHSSSVTSDALKRFVGSGVKLPAVGARGQSAVPQPRSRNAQAAARLSDTDKVLLLGVTGTTGRCVVRPCLLNFAGGVTAGLLQGCHDVPVPHRNLLCVLAHDKRFFEAGAVAKTCQSAPLSLLAVSHSPHPTTFLSAAAGVLCLACWQAVYSQTSCWQ